MCQLQRERPFPSKPTEYHESHRLFLFEVRFLIIKDLGGSVLPKHLANKSVRIE